MNTEFDYEDRKKGVALVLIAGTFWSFAGLAVRLIESASEWQILFYRSATLLCFLVCCLLVSKKGRIIAVLRNCGWMGFWAGFVLSIGFCAWIFALTHTTVANALFLLSTAPFFAAIFGWLMLGERVCISLVWFIAVAICGVGLMVAEGYQLGTVSGSLFALVAGAGFGLFAVFLRKGRNTELEPTVLWAGLCAAAIGGLIIALSEGAAGFQVSLRDGLLCASMGVFQVGLGLVIFTHGAKHLPAAEITLLSLTEIVLGPLWVWLVIGEIPGVLTIAGGGIVLAAIAGQAFVTLRRI